jgi:hypothetical protein
MMKLVPWRSGGGSRYKNAVLHPLNTLASRCRDKTPPWSPERACEGLLQGCVKRR